ncbi:MAG: hypothetical protein KDA42_06425 [Planctomycetales bacterium]|nr:hypothetical protein [Planctomycetales bacterium]
MTAIAFGLVGREIHRLRMRNAAIEELELGWRSCRGTRSSLERRGSRGTVYYDDKINGMWLPSFICRSLGINVLPRIVKVYVIPRKDEDVRLLRHFPFLESISVAGNRYADDGIKYLSERNQIEELHLYAGLYVTPSGMAHCKNLTRLTNLSLGGRCITDDDLTKLALIPNLKVLYLYHAPVSDQAGAVVAQLAAVEEIQLSNCPIGDDGIAKLSRSSSIDVLTIYECEVTMEGILRFLRNNPEWEWSCGSDVKGYYRKSDQFRRKRNP